MEKARDAIQQIKSGVELIQTAVQELGIDLEAKYIAFRISDRSRRYLEGISAEKGAELKEIFEEQHFEITQKESGFREVDELLCTNGTFSVYFDVNVNPLDKLKAEQERIAAEIARLEGVNHGTD